MRVVVIGDALLDIDVDGRAERLCPDARAAVLDVERDLPRPGGAGLAGAVLAAGGVAVTLATAFCADDEGARLRRLLGGRIVLVSGAASGGTAVKQRFRAGGCTLLRADRGLGRANPGFGRSVAAGLQDALGVAAAVVVSDYGRGVAADPVVRELVRTAAARVPVVWDPHPRGADPLPGVIVTPNLAEACHALDERVPAPPSVAAAYGLAARLVDRWRASAVAVTIGDQGAVAATRQGGQVRTPPPHRAAGDPCGAGDVFAGRVASALGAGAPVDEAVAAGVAAATAFVTSGGAGSIGHRGGWGAGE